MEGVVLTVAISACMIAAPAPSPLTRTMRRAEWAASCDGVSRPCASWSKGAPKRSKSATRAPASRATDKAISPSTSPAPAASVSAAWSSGLSPSLTAAAMPHLTASAGKVVYLSSDAGPYGPAWPGLGAYGVSKAALERLVEAWRAEHPDVGFTNLIVGECAGGEGDAATGMNAGWDMDLAMQAYPLWVSRGCMPGKLMPVEDLIGVVHTILSTNSSTSMPLVVARGAPAAAPALAPVQ